MRRHRDPSPVEQVVLASSVKARVSLLLDSMDRNIGDLRDILLGDEDDATSPPSDR